jgi:PEP-CTERM motif-containing protein
MATSKAPLTRLVKFHSSPVLLGALAIAAATVLAIPQADAANIIGFANNATACGGSTLCSTNIGPLPIGTQGYVETGNTPFNLSTINSWFQIDTTGVSHLPNQPPEPLGGAGNFLVINDTGAVVHSFSLTLTDTFTAASPGAGNCGGSPCENFQTHGGAANFFTTFTLTGANCFSGCGTDSADFTLGTVTYNWSGGPGVPIGATFNLNFASWNNDVFPAPVPEPGTLLLLGSGLAVCLGGVAWRRHHQIPG